jgi:cysteine-rich repeat protein
MGLSMLGKFPVWLGFAALLGCNAEPAAPAVVCGDGIVDELEVCDDGNRRSGDGCSASCELEPGELELACVDLVEAPNAAQSSMLVTDEDLVLITGSIDSKLPHQGSKAWVGAYDVDGKLRWRVELDNGQPSGLAYALVPRGEGEGFMFIHSHDAGDELVEIDTVGNILVTTTLATDEPGVGVPFGLLDDPAGPLVSGVLDGDLWLARIGPDGTFETLLHEDHLGLDDRLYRLRRQGDTIAAFGYVGIADFSDGDDYVFPTTEPLLIEFDEQVTELRRTSIESGDDRVSLTGNWIEPGGDGTWYVVGTRTSPLVPQLDNFAWGAAVRDGEVLWTFESPGSVDHGPEGPFASLFGAALVPRAGGEELVAVGRVGSFEGVQPWGVRVVPGSGEIFAEMFGPVNPNGRSINWAIDTNPEGQLRIVGKDTNGDQVKQWLCRESM